MRAVRHFSLLLTMLALSVMACSLGSEAVPTTAPPQPALQVPILGLDPVSGPPGTVITLGVAGFTAGAKVNLLVTPEGGTPTTLAKDLTIAEGGILKFAISLPAQIGTVALNKTISLTLTVQTPDALTKASAVFLATANTTTAGVGTRLPTPTQSSSSGGEQVTNFFITAPAIGSVHAGTQITVTGSGATYDNIVNVQIINGSQQVLANGVATIQSAVGTIGPWQVAITIAQPAARTDAYIVAYTLNRNGNISQQASIPIVLAGAGVPTTGPVATGTTAPTAFPIIITNTPWVITATPH